MIKLLFFFSTTKIGGAETNIVKITNGLTGMGYRVFWAAIENNGPLLSLPNNSECFTEIGDPIRNPLAAFRNYKKLIKENEIQIVSAFGLRVELFVRIFSKKINSDIKIVSNIRSSDSWRNLFHTWLDRFTADKVDFWVSNSFAAVQVFAIREKLDLEKTVVIYNFVEFENIIRTFDDLQLIKIGVLANYCKAKGHFNLIKLSQYLVKIDVPFEFICAGHDYTNGKLKEEIEKCNLTNNIKLIGHVTDKKDFFNKIDIFFLPSYLEGLPTSIIEAISFQIPVIASNVDGIPEIIQNEQNGYLRKPEDLAGFINDIISLRSGKLREQFVNESLSILQKKFDKTNNLAKWDSLFKSLL